MTALRVLTRADVAACLHERGEAVRRAVARTYLDLADGSAAAPPSSFLPLDPPNRLIALTGRARGDVGTKVISSFPGGVAAGRERAHALIALLDAGGRPSLLMEGAAVSAERTAASAAVAAQALLQRSDPPRSVGVVGAGPVGFATLRHLVQVFGRDLNVLTCDLDSRRAANFAQRAKDWLGVRLSCLSSAAAAAERDIVVYATSATAPWCVPAFRPGQVVLHLSLRDLHPASLKGAWHLSDDPQQALSHGTSLGLLWTACASAGARPPEVHRLSALLRGDEDPPVGQVAVFAPFGLGALDVAVAALVRDVAAETEMGTEVPLFFGDGP